MTSEPNMTRRSIILATVALATGASMRADDLTPLFTARPDGPALPVSYRQGTILEWNPVTLENTVLVGKTPFKNLPVLGVAEAASFVPGIKVGVVTAGDTWAIIGRFVIPGTPDATDAITLIGQRLLTASISAQENTFSQTFTDLATVGPRLSDVLIPASGKVLVTVSALISITTTDYGGAMDFEITKGGAVVRTPVLTTALRINPLNTGGVVDLGASRTVPVTGLEPGALHTFTAKYRVIGPGANDSFFDDREMIVQTL